VATRSSIGAAGLPAPGTRGPWRTGSGVPRLDTPVAAGYPSGMAEGKAERHGLGRSLLIGVVVFVAILVIIVIGALVFGESPDLEFKYEGFD